MEKSLSKEVFEVHIGYVRESLKDLRIDVNTLTSRIENIDTIMLRNTLTVEEHHRRSNIIEENQAEFLKTLQSISNEMKTLSSRVQIIENNVKETHTLFDFIKGLYKNKGLIIKITLVIIGIVWAAAIEIQGSGLLKVLTKK